MAFIQGGKILIRRKRKKDIRVTIMDNMSLKFKRTVIQRAAAETGFYNIGIEEGKRRPNSSVQSDERIEKTK